MAGTNRESRRPRWPAGFLGMLVLIVAIECLLRAQRDEFDSLELAAYRFPSVMSGQVSHCSILVFGDSLAKHGVVPRVLEERLGESAFNLAVPGAPPAVSYLLLRRAFDAGARPSAVLVDFKPTNVSFDPRSPVLQMAGLASLGESLELAVSYRDPNYLATLLVARTLLSYQCRHNVRSLIARALDSTRPLDFFSPAPYRRNWEQNAGGQLNEKDSQSGASGGPRNLEAYLRPHWRANPRSERYIEKFLALASAHETPVYWLMPPTHPRLQSWPLRRRADADYDAFVAALLKRFPNVRVIDGRHAGYTADVFWDAVHLDRDGAVAFSTQVAEEIRRSMISEAGSLAERWVALARPAAEGPRPALEDVAQSRLAVAPETSARR